MTLPLSRRSFIEFMGACFTIPSFLKQDSPTHERWSTDYDHHMPLHPICTPPTCVVDYSKRKRNLHRRMVCAEGLDSFFVARAYIIDGDKLLVASYKIDEAATRRTSKTVLDFTGNPFTFRTFRAWKVSILDGEGNSIGLIVPNSLPEGMTLPTTEWLPSGSRILEISGALVSQASQLSKQNIHPSVLRNHALR